MLIKLNNYEIITKIFFDKVTYINSFISDYLNKFLLCGIIKNKNSYNHEGYLSQIKILDIDKKLGKYDIINVSKCLNYIHKGSILDGDIIKYHGEDIIITIGNDNKILIIY